ncbi:MAG TPA: hypothetical protein VFA65_10720 [Bryobacteraceae bacterium]|nr:hypothetical protein [Bryobacteraceae bacterium]
MQESESITFEPIRASPGLHLWEIVLALILFAALIWWVVWRSRKRSKKQDYLDLSGR